MVTEQRTKPIVRPLTRRSKRTGDVYVRPPHVQEQIEAALEWPLEEAFERARSGQLHPQTLVHLMRNYRPSRRTPSHDGLVVAFFSRLERAGDGFVRGLSAAQKEWVQGEVATHAMEWMHDDRMDIFEVSFRLAVKRLYLTHLARVRSRSAAESSWEDLAKPGSRLTGQEAVEHILAKRAGSNIPHVEVLATLREISDNLSENERLAVVYVEALGLKHEEAAERIGCSSRNVRYLLENVRAKAHREQTPARASAGGKEQP